MLINNLVFIHISQLNNSFKYCHMKMIWNQKKSMPLEKGSKQIDTCILDKIYKEWEENGS